MTHKLHIPAPEDTFIGLHISSAIYIFVFLGLGFLFSTREIEIKNTSFQDKDADSELQINLKNDRKLSRQFETFSVEKLKKHQWSDSDLLAVFNFGPSKASELACSAILDQIKDNSLSKNIYFELEKSLDRRSFNAPWQCIVKALLDQKLPESSLKDEAESFFQELEKMDKQSDLAAILVDGYRKQRKRPSSPRFYRWIRRCAFHTSFPASRNCQQLLKTLSPKYGRDILESMQYSFAEDRLEKGDYLAAIRALHQWVKHGQPQHWNIKKSKMLPDYEVDFKIASVLSLCKFTISSDADIRREAIIALADNANIGTQVDEKMNTFRWRSTCHYLFGGTEEDEFLVNLFSYFNASTNETHYDLNFITKNGYCDIKEEYPAWHCAIDAWIHEDKAISDALSDSFVETRFLEFEDLLPEH